MRLIIGGTPEDVWVRLEPETAEEAEALERGAMQGDWTIRRGPATLLGEAGG